MNDYINCTDKELSTYENNLNANLDKGIGNIDFILERLTMIDLERNRRGNLRAIGFTDTMLNLG